MFPDQGLVRIEPVLSLAELELCRPFIEELPFESSALLGDQPGSSQHARTSCSCLLDEGHPLALLLHSKLNTAVASYANALRDFHPSFDSYPLPGATAVASWRESTQVLRYFPGQSYVFHTDTDFERSRESFYRVLTVILYLNGDFAGGETEFVTGKVKPDPGSALVFPSNWCFPHAGCPVLEGVKYALVTWYHAYPYKDQ